MDIKSIKSNQTYSVTKHDGKVVEMKGDRLKSYLIAFKNIAPIEVNEPESKTKLKTKKEDTI
jgi:hypothetical protein